MRTILCEYCQEKIQAFSINSHLTFCEEYPIQCENKCSYGTVDGKVLIASRKVIRAHLQRECPLQQVACPYAQHGCDTNCVRKNVQQHNVDFMGKHLELVENTLKKTQISLAKQIKKKMVPTKRPPLSNGGVEWCVLYFQNRMFRNKEFQSPPLYSCGYKFRFSIQFNNQQHLGVNFTLLKEENYGKLKWPLKGDITFLLVNQSSSPICDYKRTISSEDHPLRGWFERPTAVGTPQCYGFVHFISHLNLSKYIMDDSILLRVVLTCI